MIEFNQKKNRLQSLFSYFLVMDEGADIAEKYILGEVLCH